MVRLKSIDTEITAFVGSRVDTAVLFIRTIVRSLLRMSYDDHTLAQQQTKEPMSIQDKHYDSYSCLTSKTKHKMHMLTVCLRKSVSYHISIQSFSCGMFLYREPQIKYIFMCYIRNSSQEK